MILKDVSKAKNLELCEKLTERLMKHALFMHFCPNADKRAEFINAYLHYYIYEWSEYDTLLTDENEEILATLIDPHTFEYKFKGKGAMKLKKQKDAKAIFVHREIVKRIVHIVAPGFMNPRVFNIYATAETDVDAINSVVEEAIRLAKENNYTLVYETFSQRLITFMKNKGFEVGYQKQYMDTRFVETLMTYHPRNTK